MTVHDLVIVDYGMGNVGSIRNMLSKIGVRAHLSREPDEIAAARRVVLPGVGAFGEAMTSLRKDGLVEALISRAHSGRGPLLGVCLGMQLLLDSSDEGGERGLGLIPGQCRRFPSRSDAGPLRVPHMGWNEVSVDRPSPLLPSLGTNESRYYFVHSYFAEPTSQEHVLGTTSYSVSFASAIAHEEIVGVQFHPEKSHRHGLRLFADFVGA